MSAIIRRDSLRSSSRRHVFYELTKWRKENWPMRNSVLFEEANHIAWYNLHEPAVHSSLAREISWTTSRTSSEVKQKENNVSCIKILHLSWMIGKLARDVKQRSTEIPSWRCWWMCAATNCMLLFCIHTSKLRCLAGHTCISVVTRFLCTAYLDCHCIHCNISSGNVQIDGTSKQYFLAGWWLYYRLICDTKKKKFN